MSAEVGDSTPLTRAHPDLEALPLASLSAGPSPVRRLKGLSRRVGGELFLKDDGHYGEGYGGNKVRKLEYLLGDALVQGADTMVVSGKPSSNHVVATAVSAARGGLRTVALLLLPQRPGKQVKRALALLVASGADVRLVPAGISTRIEAPLTQSVLAELRSQGRTPYVLPFAGTNALGSVGYVDAAFELREQIDRGEVPEPGRIYVGLGSMGTAAGLAVGLAAAGVRAKLVGVRVVSRGEVREERFSRLCGEIVKRLRNVDPSFPEVTASAESCLINHDFAGPEYGSFTREAASAADLLWGTEHVGLDGVYTSKVFAAFLADVPKFRDQNLMYWGTADALAPEMPPLDSGALSADFSSLLAEGSDVLEERFRLGAAS